MVLHVLKAHWHGSPPTYVHVCLGREDPARAPHADTNRVRAPTRPLFVAFPLGHRRLIEQYIMSVPHSDDVLWINH